MKTLRCFWQSFSSIISLSFGVLEKVGVVEVPEWFRHKRFRRKEDYELEVNIAQLAGIGQGMPNWVT